LPTACAGVHDADDTQSHASLAAAGRDAWRLCTWNVPKRRTAGRLGPVSEHVHAVDAHTDVAAGEHMPSLDAAREPFASVSATSTEDSSAGSGASHFADAAARGAQVSQDVAGRTLRGTGTATARRDTGRAATTAAGPRPANAAAASCSGSGDFEQTGIHKPPTGAWPASAIGPLQCGDALVCPRLDDWHTWQRRCVATALWRHAAAYEAAFAAQATSSTRHSTASAHCP